MQQSLTTRILPVEGAEPDYLLKIILVGDSGVGKTNILNQFVKNQFNPDSKATVGVEFAIKTVQINGKTVKAQIWDTAGQERYRAVTANYYKGASGAMLVYDITNSISFNSVRKWLKEIQDKSDTNQRTTIMLVGNKCDLDSSRSIPLEEARALADNENMLFLETSAMSSENIQEAFTALISTILDSLIQKDLGQNSDPNAVSSKGVKITNPDKPQCC